MDIPIIPHEQEPGVDCCGCLVLREYGGDIELFCNECGAIVVRGEEKVEAYVGRFLGDPTKVPMHICPHCGSLNTFPQFEMILAYTCENCGKGVSIQQGGPMERYNFLEGEEPEVLTSISEQCAAGACDQCPGIFRLEEYGDQQIFCIHSCHEKPRMVV